MTTVIGLTGSIGMGKSTTAKMFADEGIPVWDADAVVHRLYGPNGAAVDAIMQIAPDAIEGNSVSRPRLREAIAEDASLLGQINKIVHPLVTADRLDFLRENKGNVVLLDVPLLFETGAEELCDLVVVVSAPAHIQRERVLSRGEMTEAEFQMILDRQMPDAEKRARADVVIETATMDAARAAVRKIVKDLELRNKDA